MQRLLRDFNPATEIYLLKQNGEFALTLSPSSRGRSAARVDPTSIKTFVNKLDPNHAPFYMEDPGHENRKVVFSAAPLNWAGEDLYLVTVLNTWRTWALYSFLGTNSVVTSAAIFFLLSFLLTAVTGLVLLSSLTKRFSKLTELVCESSGRSFERRVPVVGDD